MEKPPHILQYQRVEVPVPDRLTSSEIGALRLAGCIWIIAAVLYAMINMILGNLFAEHVPWWMRLRHSILQPNIVGGASVLRYWYGAPIDTAVNIFSALLWGAACWLMTDVMNQRLRKAALYVRLAAVAALVGGLAANLLPWDWQVLRWAPALVSLDVLLALAVSNHLLELGRLVQNRALHWIARRLIFLIGADLLLTMLALASLPDVRGRMELAADAIAIVYSVLLLSAMLLLMRINSPGAQSRRIPTSIT